MNFKNNEEDYVKTIYSLCEAFSSANENQISKDLNVSMATASEYLSKLEKRNIITRNNRNICLTPQGYIMAIPIIKKHRISEVFAVKMLEVPWEYSHSAVMDIEHTIDDKYFETFARNLGNPVKCPHGNMIYLNGEVKDVNARVATPGKYRINRIVYENSGILKQLADLGMYPGTDVNIIVNNVTVLSNANGELKLSLPWAKTIRLVK
ncbi:metal-dependent transcriptional regulator [Ferroplasma sp.]|uniref:metal-dependent transcriptional regulator n=1 Tax=Ferroplasma sp. TaxID=2591003 RepID=UPI00307E226C